MANLTTTGAGTVSATTFSGSGASLTGLNATNFSAGSAITRANVWSKGIVFYTNYTNTTRVDTPTDSNYTLYSFTFTKQLAGTTILVDGVVPSHTQQNGGNYWFIGMDGSRIYDGIVDLTIGSGPGGVSFYKTFTGLSAGSHTVTIGWAPNEGSANDPSGVVNPSSADGTGGQQSGSQFHIWEMQA
jgi:hypothetical protein